MKVTKYPQSCLVIEKDGKNLFIDPGVFVSQEYTAESLPKPDIILITHEHPDHADPILISKLVQGIDIPVVANASAKKLLGDAVTRVIDDGERIELAGFGITAHELPHMKMVDGSDGPQNTGYVIDGAFFHPGDGLEPANVKVEKSAVPIAGPDASPRDVHGFITAVGCKKVVPIHFDNAAFPGHPEPLKGVLEKLLPDVEVVIIPNGESAEI